MDPTTLVTFLFRAPIEASIVELLGSWDNFQIPYRMHHDRLRGSNFWTGCFKYEHIIFDGDNIQWAKPRTGGLKQGGTYWYYYRLDYDVEAYDERQPHTNSCPLLPGQPVNVMEVPSEVLEPLMRCHSADGYDVLASLAKLTECNTLDPADKYATVEPPPISKVHTRCLSDDQLYGRLEGQPSGSVGRALSPISALQSEQARAVSPSSRGSIRAGSEISVVSSIYSQCGSRSVPPTATSAVSEMSGPFMRQNTSSQSSEIDDQLPLMEYPSMLADAPLGSSQALGAVLFPRSNDRSPVEAVTPSAINLCQADERRRDSTFSCGPASIHNVQFYGSRPGTSLGDEDDDIYQPRTYSLPNSDLSDGSPEVSPTSSSFPTSAGHEYMDCIRLDRDGSEPPNDESEALELTSPTFTATTVSTGGNNTPFRLSAYDASGEVDLEQDAYIVCPRSAVPTPASSRNESVSSGRPSLLERGLARLRPTFGLNYSLPSMSSDSLAKTLTHNSTRVSREEESRQLPLPSIGREERSMADAIFSELGFLSSSIT